MTDITRKYKRLTITFTVLSWASCFGLALVLIIIALVTNGESNGPTFEEVKNALGTVLWGFIMSLMPMLVLAIIVKDKVKPLVWVANIIMANAISTTLMYVVFVVWLLEEYVFGPLKNHYKEKYHINKTIDERGKYEQS